MLACLLTFVNIPWESDVNYGMEETETDWPSGNSGKTDVAEIILQS